MKSRGFLDRRTEPSLTALLALPEAEGGIADAARTKEGKKKARARRRVRDESDDDDDGHDDDDGDCMN